MFVDDRFLPKGVLSSNDEQGLRDRHTSILTCYNHAAFLPRTQHHDVNTRTLLKVTLQAWEYGLLPDSLGLTTTTGKSN